MRKTTSEWAADTATYPEGMRLMDTDTGTVRVSKGTTYAQAWVQSSGGGASAWGDITGTLSDQTDLQAYLETLANGIGAIVTQTITNGKTTTSPSEDAVFDALAGKADAEYVEYAALLSQSGTQAPLAIILKNNIGGTIVWTRLGAGTYLGTLSGAFPDGKTVIVNGSQVADGIGYFVSAKRATDNTVVVQVADSALSVVDDELENTTLIIRVYP